MPQSEWIIEPQQTMATVAAEKEPIARESGIANSIRTVLLVEHREEVYVQLADDLREMGIWVERACSAAEAYRQFTCHSPHLTIANTCIPNNSGWLLAAKLRLTWPTARIWLYTPCQRLSTYDCGLTRFLGVAELINYQSDLGLLAEEIHRRLVALKSMTLQTSGIVDDIEKLVREAVCQGGLEIVFHAAIDCKRLPPVLENALYLIIWKSLANARHRGQSDRVEIELTQRSHSLRLVIQERGSGLGVNKVAKGCLILVGIHDHTKILGGHASIESEVGYGTRIVVELPLPDQSRHLRNKAQGHGKKGNHTTYLV